MSKIIKPRDSAGAIEGVTAWLDAVADWQAKHPFADGSPHPRVWYRGHDDAGYLLEPGVYRKEFVRKSRERKVIGDEQKLLRLERDLLVDFRITGATLFDAENAVELYFIAQHHGMKTRLLDWTTNPLAALFFAARKKPATDGEIFVMNASRVLPDGRSKDPMDIISQRHPFARGAIRQSFWTDRDPEHGPPLIFPLRPDSHVGRVVQQSSCFTMHMHKSDDRENPTLWRYTVPHKKKGPIIEELRKIGVTEFTVFRDLDSLSCAVLKANGLLPPVRPCHDEEPPCR